jgi:large subunit ribosomal protein L23
MADNVYSFIVHDDATKTDVKWAIENIFKGSNAKVEKVNIMKVIKKSKKVGKYAGWKKGYKKALVYLKDGSIPIFGQEEDAEIKKLDSKKKPTRQIVTGNVNESTK